MMPCPSTPIFAREEKREGKKRKKRGKTGIRRCGLGAELPPSLMVGGRKTGDGARPSLMDYLQGGKGGGGRGGEGGTPTSANVAKMSEEGERKGGKGGARTSRDRGLRKEEGVRRLIHSPCSYSCRSRKKGKKKKAFVL